MLKTILTMLICFAITFAFGQTKGVSCEKLSQQATTILFTDSLKQQLGITYPICRVYNCTDKSGQFYIVLTESNDTITADNDTTNYKIKGFKFQYDRTGYTKKWEINDFVTKQASSDEMESTIWFWTRYSKFTDIDHDSLIDPIIIYGTSGMNYTSDGRIKILIYYKGQKFAIRHQNGVLDFERNTKVDQAFYTLPISIQDQIKMIIKKMTDDGNAIFPYGWQSAMKNHAVYFDENKK